MELDKPVLSSIAKIYGSFTHALLKRLVEPPRRLYLRVNTLRICREELLSRLRDRGVDAKPDPHVEEAIYVELEGPFEIPRLDKVIYVDRNTAESVMTGSNLYRPGILKFSSFMEGEEVSVISPTGESIAIVKTVVSSNQILSMTKGLVGVNKISRYKAPPLRELPEFEQGMFYPQSLPAMIATKILNPTPKEFVIDLNAAPGGKSSHVIQLTRSSAMLVSIDRNVKKCLRMKEVLDRLFTGYNINIVGMDSRYVDRDLHNLQGRVDKVIVDPPCSALGVRPKSILSITFDEIIDLREYQYQFLKVASRIVKKDGLILYCTCTITFDENEYNVSRAVDELGLEPIDIVQPPYSEKIQYRGIVVYRYSPLTHDMPGFFISLLKKK